MMDKYAGQLDRLGCVLVMTADHGMNDKHLPNGEPDVIYLQDLFDQWLGKDKARVILPITDPYVAHHGALGSFATVYLPEGAKAAEMIAKLSGVEGIDVAITRDEACKRFDLPPDRIGDVVTLVDHPQGARHQPRPPRSVRLDRAAALAWRTDRTDRADDRQPQGHGAGGS